MSEWFAPSYTNIRTQDANLADIGIRGNHEGSATFWKQYWPEPFQSGGLYWSFDYGPIHVALLDAYTSYGAGSAQYNWLKADLAASTKTWKLVAIHEPGWSAGGGHANNTTVQNDLQPLLVQYGVSILFAGHNHYYCACQCQRRDTSDHGRRWRSAVHAGYRATQCCGHQQVLQLR